MLPEGAGDDVARAARPPTTRPCARSSSIGPDKKIKAMLTYPMSTGRNFDEVLRLLDSCQLTAKHTVATPVNWKPGEDVIIPPSVSDEQAKEKYPRGLEDAEALPARRSAAEVAPGDRLVRARGLRTCSLELLRNDFVGQVNGRHPVAKAGRRFARRPPRWTGTFSQLSATRWPTNPSPTTTKRRSPV